ncbi:MAG: DUF1579 domain-containing protein [Nitrospira sp.]
MRVNYKSIVMLALCFCVTGALALAKEKKDEKPMDPQAMMELWKKLATPGEPHKLFASLAGSWTTQTKEWTEPGKPPMESTGACEDKVILDGRFIQEDCMGSMHGQPFSGLGTHGYDNLTKQYVTTWMSTMGTGIFMMEGTASPDGKTITLRGSHPEPGGGQMSHRAIWKLVNDTTQTFEMYGKHHGGQEMKMMEITYARKP